MFGRNVTGGAAVSSGIQTRGSAVVTGPIIKNKIQAKLAVLYDKDYGYFTNEFNGKNDLGRSRTLIIRPAVRIAPTDTVEMILRYEDGRFDGDGAVPTNRGLFPADSFRVSIDNEGYAHNRWNSASAETNIDTSFGDGKITNLMAYRAVTSRASADINASPRYDYNVNYYTPSAR